MASTPFPGIDLSPASVSLSPGETQAARATQVRTLAAEFESMLLGQMLKQMRTSMFDENEDAGMGNGPLADSLYAELSLALSRAGGLGVADAMIGPLTRQAQGDAPADAAVKTGAAAFMALSPNSGELGVLPLDAVPPRVASAGLTGRVTSRYGWRRDPINGAEKFHKGVDIALPVGHDVPAARAGRVTFAGELPGYGLTVVVAHDDRLSTRYAHLSQLDVAQGAAVSEGQSLGLSGATGRTTGPHLHFEALENGQSVDPSDLLAPGPAPRVPGRF